MLTFSAAVKVAWSGKPAQFGPVSFGPVSFGPEHPRLAVKITAPKIWVTDMQKVANTMVTAATALQVAESSLWVSNEEAAREFRFIMKMDGNISKEDK